MKYVESSSFFGKLASWVKRHTLISATVVLWVFLIGITYFTVRDSAWSKLSYIEVIVASKAIPEGSLVTGDMLKGESFLDTNVPANSILYEQIDAVVDKTALVTLAPGDVITPSVVSIDADTAGKLATVIGRDKKILGISAKDVHTIPAVLRVGDHITIYNVDPKANTKVILISGVEVIQILREQKEGEEDKSGGTILSFAVTISDDGVLAISEALAKQNFLQLSIEPKN